MERQNTPQRHTLSEITQAKCTLGEGNNVCDRPSHATQTARSIVVFYTILTHSSQKQQTVSMATHDAGWQWGVVCVVCEGRKGVAMYWLATAAEAALLCHGTLDGSSDGQPCFTDHCRCQQDLAQQLKQQHSSYRWGELNCLGATYYLSQAGHIAAPCVSPLAVLRTGLF